MKNKILLFEHGHKKYRSKIKGYDDVYFYLGTLPKAKRLPPDLVDRMLQLTAYYRACQEIDWIYDAFIDLKEQEIFNKITKDNRGHCFLKKEVLFAVGKIFYSFMVADKFMEKYQITEPIDYVPNQFSYRLYKIIIGRKGLLSSKVNIPEWYFKQIQQKERKKNKIYRYAIQFYPLLVSLLMHVGPLKKVRKKSYQYGVHIWDSWFGFSRAPYRMDFLEDEQGVNPDTALYVMERKMSKENLKKLERSGYDFCYLRGMVRQFSLSKYWKEIYPKARAVAKLFNKLLSNHEVVNDMGLRTVHSFILWEMFFSTYNVKTFLAVQEPGNILRVMFQRQHGSKSVFIFLSTGYDVFPRENMNTQFRIYYSSMIYDLMISSTMSNDYIERNNNFIDQYADCGVCRSDIVYQLRNDQQLKDGLKKELGVPLEKVLIGFFDNQLGYRSHFTYQECCQMLNDIYHLLESSSNYFMIYRSRVPHALPKGSKIKECFDRLINHERIIHLNDLSAHYHAFDVMGICDLVIGGFSSSVPLESAAGGVKTMCYVTDRYNSDSLVMNTWPRFCVQNYWQLKDYTEYWLYECTQEDFEKYQDQYIKKYVDSFCDGQATNRLLKHLREFNNQDSVPNYHEEMVAV